MTHKLYVGNYPVNFTKDDVLNLFQDFDGVELVGFFRNKNKCYSFLHCISDQQLIEIVANLHDIDVCGRNLIVRAADENFHRRIQNSLSKYGAVNIHPRNTCDLSSSATPGRNEISDYSNVRSSKKTSSPQTGDSYSRNNGHKNYEMGHSNASHSRDFKSDMADSNYSESLDYSSHCSESNYSSSQCSRYSHNSLSGVGEGDGSYYSQNESGNESITPDRAIFPQENFSRFSKSKTDQAIYPQEALSSFSNSKTDQAINPQETFSRFSKSKTDVSGHYKTMSERFDSYKKNMMRGRGHSASAGYHPTNLGEEYPQRRRNPSESSLGTVHNQPHMEEFDNLSFVSVVNFPLYLPTRDLYKLFSDFNPIKVFIVCNDARVDKTPTEAIICFESEKEATDAILTLDNTIYRGRVLIVTDAVDMSLVSELLSFG